MQTEMKLNALLEEAKDRNPGLQLLAAESAIQEALQAARADERELCAAALELSNQELLLMAGEMTAQELRTVKAVLAGCAAGLRIAHLQAQRARKVGKTA
jgi:hypothetical protein